jgi:hypothetical protein
MSDPSLTAFSKDSHDAFVELPSKFMIDPATYVRGGELGFEGMDFYVAGRGGPLGDVPADVVAAAFFFFNPELIALAWDRSAGVMERRAAGQAFAQCCHDWADAHLPDGPDYARIAALLEPVTTSASPAGAPLFAAWRALREPESPKALALHRLNVLRELRGAYHEAAVMVAGILPADAVAVAQPYMLPIYGWPALDEGVPLPKEDWQKAEERTDRLFGRAFAILGEAERAELLDLLGALPPG